MDAAGTAAATTASRAHMLDGVRRRFGRRWRIGIAIGIGLAIVNSATYWVTIDGALDGVDGRSDAATSLRALLGINVALTAFALAVLMILAVVCFHPIDRSLRAEAVWLAEVEDAQMATLARRRFDQDVHEALEMAGDEVAVSAVVEHVLASEVPGRPAELMLADSSDSHLVVRAEHPDTGAAGCPVGSPYECHAIRRARPLTFADSSALNTCPHLRDRPGEVRSANCIPLSFMGRAMGVLHVVGPVGEPLGTDEVDRLTSLTVQTSTQLGTLRAFAKAQLQARTDGLTGLMNRRTAEEELDRRLGRDPFALAIVDLDNFKRVNDTHGHQAGDRALRLFADTVRLGLRADDLFARWGGEEFVVALGGMDRWQAVDALDRIRLALVDACARAETPVFTASFGVVDSSCDVTLHGLVRLADEALMLAKRRGRDRVVVGPVVAGDHDDEGAHDALERLVAEDRVAAARQPSNTTVLRP